MVSVCFVAAISEFLIPISFDCRISDFFVVGITVFFFVISWEYNLPEPNDRRIDNKTILNKFVCKGLNAIFVKLWPVF